MGKAIDKQTKKKKLNLYDLNLYDKIDELRQINGIILKNLLNDSIVDKLTGIKRLQNNIKLDDVEYTKKEKSLVLVNTHYLLFFRETYTRETWHYKTLMKNKVGCQ